MSDKVPAVKREKLTARQALFVLEYVASLNASAAAKAAGYSERAARSQGERLLKMPRVAQAIEDTVGAIMRRKEVTAERIIEGLARAAFFDPGELYDENGALRPVKELPQEVRTALSEITEDHISGGRDEESIVRRKFKTSDRIRALELLGKRLKMFTDRHEMSGEGGGPAVVIVKMYSDVDKDGKPRVQRCRCFPGCAGPVLADEIAGGQGAVSLVAGGKEGV